MRLGFALLLWLAGLNCHWVACPTPTLRFSPPGAPPSLSLAEKALRYEMNLEENHLTSDGLVAYKIRLPVKKVEEIEVLDLPDGAAWTGCALAAEAFRYAVTGEPAALEKIHRLLSALHLLQEVTGVRGLLARTFIRGDLPPSFRSGHGEWHRGQGPFSGYHWRGDVSNDQYAGVMFGYGICYDLIAEREVRGKIVRDVRALMDHIVDHSMAIVDVDGEVTTHGDMSPHSWEDLDALLALSFLKTAFHITGSLKFQGKYRELIERQGFHRRATKARDKWWEYLLGVNHSDNHLAFLGYYNLLRLEKSSELLHEYRKGLERSWKVVRNEGNSFFNFVYIYLVGDHTAELLEAVETLRLFPEEKRVVEVRNSQRKDIRKAWFSDRHGNLQAIRPLPVYQRPANGFEWKANPYRMDGNPGARGKAEYGGVDYLLAYWLGRYHGFISRDM